MLSPLNPEAHARNHFLETAQIQLDHILSLQPVIRALGAPVVENLRAANENLFIPNVRHGAVVIPRSRRDTDAVPLLALDRGTEVRFGEATAAMTPSQRERYREWLRDNTKPDIPDSNLTEIVDVTSRELQRRQEAGQSLYFMRGTRGIARAVRAAVTLTDPHDPSALFALQVDGRPVTALRYDNSYDAPVTLGHELIHVGQMLKQPCTIAALEATKTMSRRRELEAYHYSGTIAAALLTSSGYAPRDAKRLREHSAVEGFRLQFGDQEQPYEPTPILLQKLAAMGMDWAREDYLADQA